MYYLKNIFQEIVQEMVEKSNDFSKGEIQSIAFYFLEEIFEIKRIDILANKSINPNSELEKQVFLEKINQIKAFIPRIIQHEPLQHILGYTPFASLHIRTSKNALIPRPETEELVEIITNFLQKKIFTKKIKIQKTQKNQTQKNQTQENQTQENQKTDNFSFHIWDICTGTGCIALALGNFFENFEKSNNLKKVIIGTDISLDALTLAKENKALNNIKGVSFFEHDIFDDAFSGILENDILKNNIFTAQNFDIIVSNPPYICDSEKKDMQKNVLDYEPHLALFVADAEALIFYERILHISQQKLKTGGQLFFEINENFGNEMVLLFEKYHFKNITLQKDFRGKDRFIFGEK